MLVEERKKEQERERMLNECQDSIERKRLEKILAMEKADANEFIIKFNKEMDNKIKDYKAILDKKVL